MKNKIILVGKHGRPSTKLAWSFSPTNTSNPVTLVQRRRFLKKNKKLVEYYRIFGDPSIYNENQLYQIKMKNFNFSNSIIIRWGTREDINARNSIIYNNSRAISNATNKALSRRIFRDNNVSTPTLIESIDDYDNMQSTANSDRNNWVIARPHIHSKGKNLVVIKDRNSFVSHFNRNHSSWYYSEFVNKVSEFRVHIGHGKILGVMEKHNPNNGNVAWNRAINHSEAFTRVRQGQCDERGLRDMLAESIKAVEVLGLDMGAVDIMMTNDGSYYVLEVNTAPTLNSSPYIAEMWCKYWNWLLRSNEKRIPWDYNSFKKASSLFWKQDQLSS